MKLIITGIFLATQLGLFAGSRQMSLQQALNSKLVNAVVKSLGGYQGFCVQINLKNLGKDSLIILVEAGRRLNSTDDKYQDILITQQQLITLGKKENKNFTVKGYCCQASNSSPPKDAEYSINTMADSNLVKLARYLNDNEFDADIEQQAIWSISDNKPSSRVASINDTIMPVIRQFVCGLKNEQLPWYSIITRTHVFPSGTMQTDAIWLRGQLNYNCTEICYTTLRVLDKNGMEVCQIIEQWTAAGTEQAYKLNLPVKGLSKGNYTIELKSAATVLASNGFEI